MAIDKPSKSEALSALQRGLGRILADGVLTPDDIRDFWNVHDRLGLSPRDSEDLRSSAMLAVAESAIADGVLDTKEIQLLNSLIAGLKLSNQHPSVNHAIRLIQRCQLIQHAAVGQLPSVDPTGSGINLGSGELLHANFPALKMEERVINSGYVGGYSGFSFRIAKGVRWHVGGSRGRYVSERGVVPVATGRLYLTSQRIAFVGQPKSFAAKWQQVLGVDPYSDGLVVQVSNRTNAAMFQFEHPLDGEMAAVICDHLLN